MFIRILFLLAAFAVADKAFAEDYYRTYQLNDFSVNKFMRLSCNPITSKVQITFVEGGVDFVHSKISEVISETPNEMIDVISGKKITIRKWVNHDCNPDHNFTRVNYVIHVEKCDSNGYCKYSETNYRGHCRGVLSQFSRMTNDRVSSPNEVFNELIDTWDFLMDDSITSEGAGSRCR